MILLLAAPLFTAPPAAAEFTCGGSQVCDAGDECDLAVLQGTDLVSTRIEGDDVTTYASAVAQFEQRWIFTTCSNVSLRAYTSQTDSALAYIAGCRDPPCAASSTYKVYVEAVEGTKGAFCSTFSSCVDTDAGSATATKSGIGVVIPNTVVNTKNCTWATAYIDIDDDGQWSDNPIDPKSSCAPTQNLVGPLPL